MADCLQQLGTQCTVIEMNKNILAREDQELAHLLATMLSQKGVALKTSLKAVKALKTNDGVTLECVDNEGNIVPFSAQQLLLAVGRKPNIENLGLDKAGVETTSRAIVVNQKLQTTASNIYAAGDVVGPYLFSHIAEYQAVIATRNALLPIKTSQRNLQKIWVTFSDPEFASMGLTEEEARATHGDSLRIYRTYYKDYDRPHTDNRMNGMGKFICDRKGYIIGAHILGARAGELISELQLGSFYNHKFTDFYRVIHPYPTYSDIIWQASKKAYIDSLRRNVWLKMLKYITGY